jgi:hypothetical protein
MLMASQKPHRSANGGNGRYWLERDHPAGLL